MKRLLIATALEETWKDDVPVLFLGEWCRRYSRRRRWQAMDSIVQPYHWYDFAKLEKDYSYLTALHEKMLCALATELNSIHDVQHGLRYWRILIGPWLGLFIPILFDRWTTVHNAVTVHGPVETILFDDRREDWIPNDMRHFIRLMTGDEWNQNIYAAILRNCDKVACHLVKPAANIPSPPRATNLWSAKSILRNAYDFVARRFSRHSDAFLISTALPRLEEISIQLRLGQVPRIWSSVAPGGFTADPEKRRWRLKLEPESEFEQFAFEYVAQQLPAAYLEGYDRLIEQTRKLPWPQSPKLIFSSNALFHDTVTMAYTAEQSGKGVPLVYGQHGGNYWMLKLHWGENHEIEIPDMFLSWGRENARRSNIKTACFLSPHPEIKRSRKSNLVLVTHCNPRYSYSLFSGPKSSQFIDSYLHDNFDFVRRVMPSRSMNLLVRLQEIDYGWDFAERWQDQFPDVQIDRGNVPISRPLADAKLVVCTYCATTIFEVLNVNLPIIMFWNTNVNPLSQLAKPYFEELRKVGIFHDTPESAARQIEKVWDNIDDWWSSDGVADARKSFMEGFFGNTKCRAAKIAGILHESMVSTGSARPALPTHR